MTDLTQLKAELEAANAVLNAPIEGLVDLNSLNLKPKAKKVVASAHGVLSRRRGLINSLLIALAALEADGYPKPLPVVIVPDDVMDDLAENLSTIKAALSTFSRERATSLGVTVGTPVDV